ncbi:MAG: hypothetical protein L0H22_04150 [Brevibacterium aurantiacum]|nr:hypothetical protein [Brevibacterium aurantiacum]
MDDGAAIPRTRTALEAHLTKLGVSEQGYHLSGAHLDDAIVMDHCPEGWVVFYSERGGESALKVHRTEADACADLLDRRTRDDHAFFTLVAGPSPASEADTAFNSWLAARGASRSSLLAEDWKFDDVPWVAGPLWRRYFVRTTTIRLLDRAE